jgi:hypothetical protein
MIKQGVLEPDPVVAPASGKPVQSVVTPREATGPLVGAPRQPPVKAPRQGSLKSVVAAPPTIPNAAERAKIREQKGAQHVPFPVSAYGNRRRAKDIQNAQSKMQVSRASVSHKMKPDIITRVQAQPMVNASPAAVAAHTPVGTDANSTK